MLPASNRGVGMNIGFPDVCLTPVGPVVVPIPYPNFALNAQALMFSPVVKVSGVNALNMASKIPMTFGDDAGVAHPVFKQMGAYVMGNPIVQVDRLPAICLACPTTGNMMNNAVGAVLVPSAVNVLYTYRAPEAGTAGSPWSGEQAATLGDVVGGRTGEPLSREMLGGEVGCVRVRVFAADMARRFFMAARALEAEGARALVVDLRGCPGGDLDGAVALAASFLEPGAEIVRVEDGDGDETVRRATLPPVHTLPVVVLIDGGTASAAEVFAACLSAHGRATLLGARTHGKATAQRLASRGDSFDYQTAARCSGPGGAVIDGVGVEPGVTLSGVDPSAWLEEARGAARALLG